MIYSLELQFLKYLRQNIMNEHLGLCCPQNKIMFNER